MNLIRIDGSKPNSSVFPYKDWEYIKYHPRREKYYCCQRYTTKKCPVVLEKNSEGNWTVDESLHNHFKPKRNEKLEITNKLKRNSTEILPVEEIVKKVFKP